MYFSFHGTENIELKYFLTIKPEANWPKVGQIPVKWFVWIFDVVPITCWLVDWKISSDHGTVKYFPLEIIIPMSGDAILWTAKNIFFCNGFVFVCELQPSVLDLWHESPNNLNINLSGNFIKAIINYRMNNVSANLDISKTFSVHTI